MVRKTKFRLAVCATLVICNIAFIWGNSLLNGDTSGDISGGFSAWIGQFIPFLSPDSPNGHFLIRKMAHFSIFLLLGMNLCWLMQMLCKRHPFLRAFAVAACVAAIDESIQRFIPDRHGCFSDMLLDSCGALAGIGCLLLGYTLLCKLKMKKEHSI
jgi:VanZ family protein